MLAILAVVLIWVGVPIWHLLAPQTPINNLQTLDGCYEGEGLPDFMRPRRHWSLRISNGSMIDRDGNEISKILMSAPKKYQTPVSFSPGILVAGKPPTVMAGSTVTGNAYFKGTRATIILADELQQVLLKTSCS
jgi:hypothetical protein